MAISRSFLEGFCCRKDAPWTQTTIDWKHLYGSKIIKSWIFHFSKQKRITIGQAIWTLFFYYLFPKNIFDGTQLSTIERKVVSNHLSKVKLMIQCLHERYQLLFFLNVDESLRDYSSPLKIQNKAISRTTFGEGFFFHMIPFKALQNLKTVEESRTKVQFDHHCVQTNTQPFFGWQTKVIV